LCATTPQKHKIVYNIDITTLGTVGLSTNCPYFLKKTDMSIIQKEIFNTSKELAKKNKISEEYVMESLKSAIISEYTKEYVDAVVDVEIDTEKSQINISRIFTVVADDQSENFDDNVEIPLEEAKTYKADIQVGDTFKKPISFDSLNKMLIQNI
jgi:hypothetical protein